MEKIIDNVKYIIKRGVLEDVVGSAETMKIPEGVKKIKSTAFYDIDVQVIILPESINVVSEGAFSHMEKLKTVVLTNSVIEIEKYAFGNSSIEEIIIPDSVNKIGEQAFSSCKKLSYIKLPSGLEEISDSAFSHCYSLSEITFPNSLKKIGENAFHFTYLRNITIPSTVEVIGKNAFSYNPYLKYAFMNEGLKKIDEMAFYACEGLLYARVPNSAIDVHESAFWYCTKLDNELNDPNKAIKSVSNDTNKNNIGWIIGGVILGVIILLSVLL